MLAAQTVSTLPREAYIVRGARSLISRRRGSRWPLTEVRLSGFLIHSQILRARAAPSGLISKPYEPSRFFLLLCTMRTFQEYTVASCE